MLKKVVDIKTKSDWLLKFQLKKSAKKVENFHLFFENEYFKQPHIAIELIHFINQTYILLYIHFYKTWRRFMLNCEYLDSMYLKLLNVRNYRKYTGNK